MSDVVMRAHEEMKHLIAMKFMVEAALKKTLELIPQDFQENLHPLMDSAVDNPVSNAQMEYVMFQFVADNEERIRRNFNVVLKKMEDHFGRYIARVAVSQEVGKQ